MDSGSTDPHGFVRVAACTVHTVLVDPGANATAILRQARGLSKDGVNVAVFPELSLTGYSVEDLHLQDAVLTDVENALQIVVAGSRDLMTVLVIGAPLWHRQRVCNCAAVVHRGEILGVVPKSYLPNYRGFYEKRWFAGGDDQRGDSILLGGQPIPYGVDLLFTAVDVPGMVLHAEICEEMWVPIPPSAEAALAGATVLGRDGGGLCEWRAARRVGPLPGRRPESGGRHRPGTAAPGTAAMGSFDRNRRAHKGRTGKFREVPLVRA